MKVSLILLLMLGSLLSVHAKQINVLFIGNSFTFMNNMPEMFKEIGETNGKNIYVEHCTTGGKDWKFHVENDSTYDYIDSRDWDYIILQAKSWEPTESRSKVDKNTLPYGQKLVDAIRRKDENTKILLYMTWGYKYGMKNNRRSGTFFKMYDVLKTEYLRFSDVYRVPVSPVGETWKNVREKYPSLNLYQEDDFHPNIIGSYISACTFYAAIFRDRVNPEKTFKPEAISSSYAKDIQNIAYGTVLNPEKDWRFYYWPGAIEPNIAYEIKNNDILLAADAPGAEKITWVLNGDEVSNNLFFTYPVSELNKIKIKLIVEKDGEIYSSKEKVKL